MPTQTKEIRDGQSLNLRWFGPSGVMQVDCENTTLRNWSRVATGIIQSAGGNIQVFLKQFIDSQGTAHPDQFTDELNSVNRAKELFGDVLEVLEPISVNERHLVLCYEHHEMNTLDEILRLQPHAELTRKAFDYVLDQFVVMLSRMKTLETGTGTSGWSPVFKGFDVRNIGIPGTLSNPRWEEPAYLFDLGVYRRGSYTEAAARVLTTVGLLNWGSPLGRFLKGPDHQWLSEANRRLQPYLSRNHTLARLRHEYWHRLRDVQGSSWRMRQLKRIGLVTVGLWYMIRLRRAIKKLPMEP